MEFGPETPGPCQVQVVCKSCGSHNVCRDATAKWDVNTQQWYLADVQDQGTCEDCDDDADLEEVDLEKWENEQAEAEGDEGGRITQRDGIDMLREALAPGSFPGTEEERAYLENIGVLVVPEGEALLMIDNGDDDTTLVLSGKIADPDAFAMLVEETRIANRAVPVMTLQGEGEPEDTFIVLGNMSERRLEEYRELLRKRRANAISRENEDARIARLDSGPFNKEGIEGEPGQFYIIIARRPADPNETLTWYFDVKEEYERALKDCEDMDQRVTGFKTCVGFGKAGKPEGEYTTDADEFHNWLRNLDARSEVRHNVKDTDFAEWVRAHYPQAQFDNNGSGIVAIYGGNVGNVDCELVAEWDRASGVATLYAGYRDYIETPKDGSESLENSPCAK